MRLLKRFYWILFNLINYSIERGNRPVTHYGITDFDWFLSRIIPLFNETDFIGIEYVEFMEHS